MLLKDLPKIELHLHLDGSMRIETAMELANISKEQASSQMMADKKVSSLKDYLEKFNLPLALLQTKENLKRVTKELLEDLQKENVIYAEIRFAPILHTKNGLSLEEVINAVFEGAKEINNIKYNFILCMMRQDNFNTNKLIVDLAKKYLTKGVCAVDLAGDEHHFKTKEFEELFNYVKQQNIPFTIHAGEADGISSIKSALSFGTKRLGHGIRIIEDKNIIQQIKERNITLEVCPTSNLDTKVVTNPKDHPFFDLYKMNVLLTINTDNRTVSNTTLTKEYKFLENTFNLTIDDFIKCNENAIQAAFLSPKEKENLLASFKEELRRAHETF